MNHIYEIHFLSNHVRATTSSSTNNVSNENNTNITNITNNNINIQQHTTTANNSVETRREQSTLFVELIVLEPSWINVKLIMPFPSSKLLSRGFLELLDIQKLPIELMNIETMKIPSIEARFQGISPRICQHPYFIGTILAYKRTLDEGNSSKGSLCVMWMFYTSTFTGLDGYTHQVFYDGS